MSFDNSKTFNGIDASLVVTGGIYEGLAGQRRRIISIVDDIVTFEVIAVGKRLQPEMTLGGVFTRPLKNFAQWAASVVQ